MISKGFVFSVLVMAGIAVSSPISSQVAFQGILTDGSGNSYRDSTGYKVTFTLYADSIDNAEVWTEEQVVSTKQGIFSVMLGSVKSLDTVKFEQQYWLGVKRDNGGQIGKRIKLGVTPYSKRALSADTANYAKVADSALSVNGVIIKGKSIDSSKIADSTITTGKIKNGTILSEDVDTGFKAPFAGVADTAKYISTIIEGSKINTNFGSQPMITTNSVTASRFITNCGSFQVKIAIPDSISFLLNSKGLYIFKASWGGCRNEATKAWYVLIANNTESVEFVGTPTVIAIGNTPAYNPDGLELRSGPGGAEVMLKATPHAVTQCDTHCYWSYVRLDGN